MKRLTRIAAVALLLISSAVSARAGYNIVIQDQTIPVGGTGYVDVMISSNTPGGDPLQAFNLDFRLGSEGQTRLEFNPEQPDSQLTDFRYLLYGNSMDHDDPGHQYPMPFGTVSLLFEPNDRLVGGDATADFSDMLVGTTSKLLARLQVDASTGLPPAIGDVFTLSLDADNSSFQHGNLSNPTFVSFSSTTGTITIVPVPEPGVLAAIGSGLFAAFGVWLFRGTKRLSKNNFGVLKVSS
jgi:hypothetical protein